MIRSADRDQYAGMRTRFRELCEAAALATGTTVEVTFSGRAETMRNDPLLARLWRANAGAFGVMDQGHDASYGSTDMANVSWVCPTIHPDLSICAAGTAGHSTAFRDAAISPRADATTLLAATLVAQTALDLLLDPDLVEEAWRGFRGET
jgi:metal-dependent amidase/aminoacylase/carboxypeptidase family protein